MIKELENLVNKIEECATELEQIERKINEIDEKRLQELVYLVIKGIKFEKIITQWNKDKTVLYLKKDKIYPRGIMVAKVEADNCLDDEEYQAELWLMSDGKFAVFGKDVADFQFHYAERTLFRENVNPMTDVPIRNVGLLKNNENYWSIDSIIYNIEKALKDRLVDLGQRTKRQQERLDKINQFKSQQ